MTKDKFTKYPHMKNLDEMTSIYNLDEVIVTEKVHGSSMRIGMIDGALRIGGRRLEFTNISPESKDGQGFVSWVIDTGLNQRLQEKFSDHDITFYGEWFGSGTPKRGWPKIQKGIRYIDGNDFRVFDVKLDGKYLAQDEVEKYATMVGLKTLPVLYRGKPDEKTFFSFIDTFSRLGKENGIDDPQNTIEGIVIRPVEFMWAENRDPMMAKLKIGKWAERASMSKGPKTPKKKREIIPGAEEFAKEFVTEMRLEHILDQLREEKIDIAPTAMGEVMKRMGQDIKREGETALTEASLEWKDVSSFVTRFTKDIFLKFLKSC
ncbi:MAG: RNA ligase family protein [Pseudomonadota bacterium]